MDEKKIFKSKIRGNAQEVILPDFPDDDTTVTTTTTRSRRVSFGTNLVKEFIVGSAVSAQCVSEYEQAFSSSDSSNPNSSHSFVNGCFLEKSTFTIENHKNSIDHSTFTIENHKEQIRQSTFTIENEKENIRHNTFILDKQKDQKENIRQNTFTLEKQKDQKENGRQNSFIFDKQKDQKENNRQSTFIQEKQKDYSSNGPKGAGKTSCEFDPNENYPKRQKFSRTICFNVDSPTADMEFTEGCLTLAKTILDKKNKDMRVIIQAESKDEEINDKSENTKYYHDMTLTQCIMNKENRKSIKPSQEEKSKIFHSLIDDTETCTLFAENIAHNFNENSLDDSLKENRMPLDLIMQQLDKNNSDSEDSLYPEKTLNAALNVSILDSDEKDDKLSLNESMDISLDFPPKKGTSTADEFNKEFSIENQSLVLKLNNLNDKDKSDTKEDSFSEVKKDIYLDSDFTKESGEEEMEITLNGIPKTDIIQENLDVLKQKNQALERKETDSEKEISQIINDNTKNFECYDEIDYSIKINDKSDVKENIPESSEISLVKENANDDMENFMSITEQSKNVANLQKSILAENSEIRETNLEYFLDCKNGMPTEFDNEEKEKEANKREEFIEETLLNSNNETKIITIEKTEDIISKLPFDDKRVIEKKQTEEAEKLNKEPIINTENKLIEVQLEKTQEITKEASLIDLKVIKSKTVEIKETSNSSFANSRSIEKEQGAEKLQRSNLELSLIESGTAQGETSKEFEPILLKEPLSQNELISEKASTDSKLFELEIVDNLQIEEFEVVSKEPSIISDKMIEDQLIERIEEDSLEQPTLSGKIIEDQLTEEFEEVSLESADNRSTNQHIEEDMTSEPLIVDDKKSEAESLAKLKEETSELFTNNITNEKNKENEELENVLELPLVKNNISQDKMEKPEGINPKSKLVNSETDKDQLMKEADEIAMETPLVDSRILENLKIQSEESNCLWILENWKYNAKNNEGVWNFSLKLLESYTKLVFHLSVCEGENMVSLGVVKSSSIHLNEETEHRRQEYYPALEYGYLRQREYIEEKKKMVKTVRRIPYFLDLMNSYMIKLNSYLSQIYSILTLYPGSRIENSVLTFRLFSFPIFFSCNVSVNLTDFYQLSKSSISFEYDFGSLDESKILDIFEECLSLNNPLTEFIVRATKHVLDLEKKSGKVSKRSYLRLLPPEIRY